MHSKLHITFASLLIVSALVLTSTLHAQEAQAIDASHFVNFFSLPFDTSRATMSSMREVRSPAGFRYIDFAIGKGDTAASGKRHFIRFFGTHSDGQPFDTTYCGSKVFSFVMGNNEVVKGLELGIQGMREGGRRELMIPPALAYDQVGYPSAGIVANETLIFYVELEKVE